ncbi:MAG: EAL domain-containing protein [Gammaproteobacteria bacterium]|nr:EAL domain-containing protein [Gammaproteobacteria bacterium]
MSEILITSCMVFAVSVVVFWVWSRVQSKQVNVNASAASDDSRLHTLIEGIIGTTGETFFYALVRELAQYLEIDAVFIACRRGDDTLNFRTQAYWCDEGYIMNQTISIADSPCTDGGGFWFLETAACDLFPNSSLLQNRFPVAGFFAVHLQDSSGSAIGLLAGMHRFSLRPDNHQIDIIKLFSARAASELERNLAVSETMIEKERAQITLHSIGDGVITTDSNGCIDYMNPVAESLTGWRYHQSMGMSMEAILHLEDEVTGRVIPDPAHRCLSEKRIIAPKTDNVLISRNGDRFSIQGTAAPMLDIKGFSIGVVLVFKDVTDSRRMQKMIVHQATHDPLTGLVNRSEFEERLTKAVDGAKEFKNDHALLFLDLDQFKIVNDTAGHVAGDELLKQISTLLASQLRGRDTLGRLGGDEFSVLLENCPLSKAKRVAVILIDAIREYRFIWEDKTYQVGVSIGVVAVTSNTNDKTELMNWADQACYAAKDLGRSQAYVFSEKDLNREAQQVSTIQRSDLEEAIAGARFELFYQPIVPLTEVKHNVHTKAEVLLRLLGEGEGEAHVSPGAFIPAANRYGLMPQVDRWVVRKLFEDYAYIFMQNPDLVLSLNLSAQAIADDSMIDYVIKSFEQTVVSPHQICFEITEAVLINNFTSASVFIQQIGSYGCAIALDNFGSSLSSFSSLRSLKIDLIKIDGALIRDVMDDAVDQAMIESINNMAHLLGIETVAECADSEVIIQELKKIGLDYGQGYHLSEPVSMNNFTNLRSSSTNTSDIQVN